MRLLPAWRAGTVAVVLATTTPAALVVPVAAAAAPTSRAPLAPRTAIVPRASLTDIENDVMCTLCHEPLAVSQSPEANDERDFISRLIAKGQTKPQIERALVAQYGPSVLALPPAHGFNVTIYILPPALLLAGIAVLAVALTRWRRRARAAATGPAAGRPSLQPTDAQRLETELARFDG